MDDNEKQEGKLHCIRHSSAHLLAQAVKQLFPDVHMGIGPVIEDGFYYDFFRKESFTPEDLKKINKKMKDLVSAAQPIQKIELSSEKEKEFLAHEPLKKELYDELKAKGEKPTFYGQGNFVDLCRGPHVQNTKELKYFTLTKVSGAYWKGDSKKAQLQRIYGLAYETEEGLKQRLQELDDAEKYNHRKIGEEMELFALFELVGKGLPVWLPKGEIIRSEIEKFAIETEAKAGYVRVSTPHLAKKELFVKSGHLPYYADSMYPSMKMDDGEYYLKAMNCPIHHLIYSRGVRSYRELPLRVAEYGTCYRNELSGTLVGLQRVRMLSMNDAHIYCTREQMEQEIENVLKMIQFYFTTFGFENYWFRLSLGDRENKEKYIDEPENWVHAEEVLRKVLKRLQLKYVEAKDEAAFYGPKIDVQFKNVFGREDTMSTVQLDFAAKKRFELYYDDAHGKQSNEVFVIHRAPLSTHERFTAFLIELYKGKFPLWLNPVQVRILTVNEKNSHFAREVMEDMKMNGIRAEIDERNESIGKKVRSAIVERVSYMVTIGDQEQEKKTLAVRDREGKVEHDVAVTSFTKKILDEIRKKC
ncbi:threonine--tRNA ligase [Candidatus Woesearchaeota archaeon]|nr:threonine--tRNA ligase [Candidatus Woesearchaeota archaeon]